VNFVGNEIIGSPGLNVVSGVGHFTYGENVQGTITPVGTGDLNKLTVPFLTGDADVKADDLLVTSGLGGIFPAGYPVARISKVERDPAETFAVVEAKPLAHLDRDREVLLVWYQEPQIEAPADAASSKAEGAKGAAKAGTKAETKTVAPAVTPPSQPAPASQTPAGPSSAPPSANPPAVASEEAPGVKPPSKPAGTPAPTPTKPSGAAR